MSLRDLFLGHPALRWVDRAACATADPEEFVHTTADVHPLCLRCPVLRECGDHAAEHREVFGIWGGINRTRVN